MIHHIGVTTLQVYKFIIRIRGSNVVSYVPKGYNEMVALGQKAVGNAVRLADCVIIRLSNIIAGLREQGEEALGRL